MDADRNELVRTLFALATEVAEAALDTAVSGQASSLPAADLIQAADALHRHASDLQAIARAVTVAAGGDCTESSPEKPF